MEKSNTSPEDTPSYEPSPTCPKGLAHTNSDSTHKFQFSQCSKDTVGAAVCTLGIALFVFDVLVNTYRLDPNFSVPVLVLVGLVFGVGPGVLGLSQLLLCLNRVTLVFSSTEIVVHKRIARSNPSTRLRRVKVQSLSHSNGLLTAGLTDGSRQKICWSPVRGSLDYIIDQFSNLQSPVDVDMPYRSEFTEDSSSERSLELRYRRWGSAERFLGTCVALLFFILPVGIVVQSLITREFLLGGVGLGLMMIVFTWSFYLSALAAWVNKPVIRADMKSFHFYDGPIRQTELRLELKEVQEFTFGTQKVGEGEVLFLIAKLVDGNEKNVFELKRMPDAEYIIAALNQHLERNRQFSSGL